ncbi:MAG: circadian clock KaiB family protein [Thermoanaerobaculia bacterium]
MRKEPAAADGGTRKTKLVLRLYVAGSGPNSAAALSNLRDLLAVRSGDEDPVEFEVVNVLREAARAFEDSVIVSPTLVRLHPLPVVRIVGTLCDHEAVRLALGLPK